MLKKIITLFFLICCSRTFCPVNNNISIIPDDALLIALENSNYKAIQIFTNQLKKLPIKQKIEIFAQFPFEEFKRILKNKKIKEEDIPPSQIAQTTATLFATIASGLYFNSSYAPTLIDYGDRICYTLTAIIFLQYGFKKCQEYSQDYTVKRIKESFKEIKKIYNTIPRD